MAARREQSVLAFDELVAFSREAIARRKDVLLIEGVGGVMVPLDEEHTVLDWMVALNLPVILVAGSYLGTISHTLTALDVLGRNDVEVAAIVVSESEKSTVPLDDTVASIVRFANSSEVVGLPRLPVGASKHPAFRRLSERMTSE